MLKLEQIVKTYSAADIKVTALKGVSVQFRENEFVSVLGPSGCGKTTLLNIIGGLDHYDEGDLIINGKSTHDFTEHDWDVYRNRHIGFVFQSYNLIPQSTILENVELALTIAGLKKEERIAKAKAALEKVGLAGLEKKHPNQLSGGQCQRVAIARALVNEPDILLADEPTGALDSVTSVQIMDLIKEVAKEKLVIMVTHNPDLAAQYSTRIINLKDGLIESDSMPYEAEENIEISQQKPTEKAKMSWWTAFKLSAKNLMSKFKRTALTVVAASIGIVGVSAVLAVSNGISEYVVSIQDDLLSGNPVYAASSSYDLSALLNLTSSLSTSKAVASSLKDGKIDVEFLVETLSNFTESIINNNISEDYVRYIDQMPASYYSAIAKYYGIDILNHIYTDTKLNTGTDGAEEAVNISLRGATAYCENILKHANDGAYAPFASLVSRFTEVINQGIDNEEYILGQYDIVDGGYFPKEKDELLLVLNSNDQTSDLVLTMLGYFSQNDFETDMDYFTLKRDEQEIPADLQQKFDAIQNIDISRIKAKRFHYYPNNTIYNKLYTDGVLNTYLKPFSYNVYENPSWTPELDLKITGILRIKEGTNYGSLTTGLYYTPALTKYMLEQSLQSEIVTFLNTYLAYAETMFGMNPGGYVSSTALNIGLFYDLNWYFKGESGTEKCIISSSTASGVGSIMSRRALGGATLPSRVEIYPTSFNDKYKVTDYLDDWNGEGLIQLKATDTLPAKDLTAEQRDPVKYNDDLKVIIFLINSMIEMITVALIAFTSLSLVVSTVMIAIITYVSVIERIKEIGVIRALGGRKKDVSHLFNAETFIVGLVSGLFGIAVTYLLQGILNIIVSHVTSIGTLANLTFWAAAIILAIAILLTMIAGFIPSRLAAKKDPVVALRTE